MQPSQDKQRPAQRTRPRTSTPGSSRGAPGPVSGGGRASTHIRTGTEADRRLNAVVRLRQRLFKVTSMTVVCRSSRSFASTRLNGGTVVSE